MVFTQEIQSDQFYYHVLTLHECCPRDNQLRMSHLHDCISSVQTPCFTASLRSCHTNAAQSDR